MSFKKSTIKLSDTKQFSKLMLNYIDEEEKLRHFYTYKPTIESFKKVIEDKSKEQIKRLVICDL